MGDLRRLSTGFQNEMKQALDDGRRPHPGRRPAQRPRHEEPPRRAEPSTTADAADRPIRATEPLVAGPAVEPPTAPTPRRRRSPPSSAQPRRGRRSTTPPARRGAGGGEEGSAAERPSRRPAAAPYRPPEMSTAAVPAMPDDGRMSLMEHLAELRDRLIKVVIARRGRDADRVRCSTTRSSTSCIAPYEDIANDDRRRSPTAGCSPIDPLEGFGIRMKLALYGGIALAMPVILWQIWRFVTPGPLRAREALRDPVRASAPSRSSCSAPASPTTRCRRALEFLHRHRRRRQLRHRATRPASTSR